MADSWEHHADLDCVECPDCAFCFQDVHRDRDGGYSCPACAEIALTSRVAALETALRKIRDEAYPTDSWFADIARAALAGSGTEPAQEPTA